MIYEIFLNDLFDSIPDYRKIVLLLSSLFHNDKDLLREIGFSERAFNRLYLEFKDNSKEQHEEFSENSKYEAESFVERSLNELMERNFATIFEDVRHERSLILFLSLVEPNILKQSNFADHEIDIIKNIALEKLHRQRILKESLAFSLLE